LRKFHPILARIARLGTSMRESLCGSVEVYPLSISFKGNFEAKTTQNNRKE
jgi:hypothetical protein